MKPLRTAVVDLIKVSDFNLETVNWDQLQEDTEAGATPPGAAAAAGERISESAAAEVDAEEAKAAQ